MRSLKERKRTMRSEWKRMRCPTLPTGIVVALPYPHIWRAAVVLLWIIWGGCIFIQIHSVSTYKNCTDLLISVRVYIDVACINILRLENRQAQNFVYIFFCNNFIVAYFIIVFYTRFYTRIGIGIGIYIFWSSYIHVLYRFMIGHV